MRRGDPIGLFIPGTDKRKRGVLFKMLWEIEYAEGLIKKAPLTKPGKPIKVKE